MSQAALFDDFDDLPHGRSIGEAMPDPPRARARTTDSDTSQEAAASIAAENIRRSQTAILAVLRQCGPMTDVDLVKVYESSATSTSDDRLWVIGYPEGRVPQQSQSGIRTRRDELVKQDQVRNSGERRKLPSGRNAIVWEAVPE
jgi:hypothetical protein